MITVITSVPGGGKTALIVSMMLTEEKKGERPLFVMGINELTVEHIPVPPLNEWTEQRPDKDDPSVMLDYFTFPPNSILIVDEAQRVFRPRSTSSKVPSHVAALETHRHTGIDIWLISQKPHLLDSNVRELCGRHIHIKVGLLGKYLYEWPEYNDVKVKDNFKVAASKKYSPPKESFAYYKSAEIHTKNKRPVHKAFYILAIATIFAIYNGYNLYQRTIGKKEQPIIAEANATPQKVDEIPEKKINPIKDLKEVIFDQKQEAQEKLHPYKGFDFVIKGTIKSQKYNATYYELIQNERRILTTDTDLKKLGYEINQPGDCSAFLFFQGAQIVATCTQQTQDFKPTLASIKPPQISEVYAARHVDSDFTNAPGMASRSSPNGAPAN